MIDTTSSPQVMDRLDQHWLSLVVASISATVNMKEIFAIGRYYIHSLLLALLSNSKVTLLTIRFPSE